MPKIQVLSQDIADKIAAGEVAERPSAVVKELVENSIDAGATSVDVEIRNGGIEYIRVCDNGCGIDADQTETAFLRHATSKLKSVDDLYNISTMGFRGEALSSICAVADVELITKTKDAEEGVFLRLSRGSVVEKNEIACADGTTIVVEKLFENIPARMKFLKRNSTESGYVADLIGRIALAHPEIAFSYTCDGKVIFSTAGDGKLQNVILNIYGLDHAKAVIPVDFSEDNVRISGVVGKPEIARGNRTRQTLLVNGRYVKSNVVSKIVSEAYRNYVMIGKFPFFVINIEIAYDCVDVNVHPAKTEIKFSNENRIYQIVYHAVSNALYGEKNDKADGKKTAEDTIIKEDKVYVQEKLVATESTNTAVNRSDNREKTVNYGSARNFGGGASDYSEKVNPKVVKEYLSAVTFAKDEKRLFDGEDTDLPKDTPFDFLEESSSRVLEVRENDPPSNAMSLDYTTASGPNVASDESVVELKENKENTESIENIGNNENADAVKSQVVSELPKPIAQVFDTYVLCQSDDILYVIDQHAAHERYRFEALKKSYYANERMSQMLLAPIVLKLDYSEAENVLSHIDVYERFGFDISDFGSGSIIVNATPIAAGENVIRDLILEISDAIAGMGKHSIADFEERTLDMIACKYAIKANHKLNYAEMQDIIEKVWTLEEDGIKTCPHGRPIKTEITKIEMEKMFKRRV